ncbi:MAG: DsbA family protein [Alphaproteobacteria bacterium]|jgi:protein-disulfide isomerase|nr:DsbA family protein [Alphaproteobacteria bacterium]
MIARLAMQIRLKAGLAPPRHAGLAAKAALALGLAGLLAACQGPRPDPPNAEDMSLGAANAPVTLIEYASVGCPHCADFNNTVFPRFKAAYVDTGKVRYIVREAAAGDTGLAAAGFLAARCAGPGHYFTVLDAVYRVQARLYDGSAPESPLLEIAHAAQLSPQAFEACISDSRAVAALRARWAHAARVEHVRRTPTFVINGKVYQGELSWSQLQADLAKAGARA